MNRNLLVVVALIAIFPVLSWGNNPVQNDRNYQTYLDLTNIVDGRIRVTVVPPVLEEDTVIYNMPKIIPGTYKIYNYGRFVNDIKAFNSKGEEIEIEELNVNQWRVVDAKNLYKIEYWASDSYSLGRSGIFAPAGTGISSEAFMLNNFGFIGYLEGYKNVPFQLEVSKPAEMYGTTALPFVDTDGLVDRYESESYFQLHDCPILYAKPDTASFTVAGVPIKFGVYSSEGHISAKEIRDAVKPVFEAAASYLGGELPAEEYAVLIYGLPIEKALSGTGALEHHTSTVVNMPDVESRMLAMFSGGGDPYQVYRDIIAHEFLHIVTPLNIHAKQINDYDFINPQMSEHLWLYEGVTEYNAMISQARAGVTTLEDFVDELQLKMETARQFNEDIPFTQMSKYALSFFSNQYYNVYQKGALIGLATDLKLRTLTDGDYGLINLLKDLWQTYGQDTFFVDDALFNIIAETSDQPEMVEFFARHVAGAEPLPLEELLAEVGIDYQREIVTERISIGGIKLLKTKEADGMMIMAFDASDAMVKGLGIEKYDVLTKWNGIKVTGENGKEVLRSWAASAAAGDEIEVEVMREVKKGKRKKQTLKSRANSTFITDLDVISINENLTDKQRSLRLNWINQ